MRQTPAISLGQCCAPGYMVCLLEYNLSFTWFICLYVYNTINSPHSLSSAYDQSVTETFTEIHQMKVVSNDLLACELEAYELISYEVYIMS